MSNVKLCDITYPYVNLELLDGQAENVGINLSIVYMYIDQHKNMGSIFPYGNAYKIIRLRATQLTNRNDIKISKREVSSLINYKFFPYLKNYIKIPYKLHYIFLAIFQILSELEEQNPLPTELKNFLETDCRKLFYSIQSELYKEWIKDNMNKLTIDLYHDIFAANSILSKKFKEVL